MAFRGYILINVVGRSPFRAEIISLVHAAQDRKSWAKAMKPLWGISPDLIARRACGIKARDFLPLGYGNTS
jgi:hypothetical protein